MTCASVGLGDGGDDEPVHSPASTSIPRAQIHRAVDELHRAAAVAFGPPLAAGGLTPERLPYVVRMVVLRGLAAAWSDGRAAPTSHDAASIRWWALEGFASLADAFEGALPFEPGDREIVADVAAEGSGVEVPCPQDPAELAAFLGAAYEALLSSRARSTRGIFALVTGVERRRSGAHHTEPRVARDVVARALSPLLPRARSNQHGPLLICDPAMGSGAFLVEVARFLAQELGGQPGDWVVPCLHGTDSDPVAVDLARVALFCLAGRQALAAARLRLALVRADFVVRPDATLFGVSIEAPPLDPLSTFADVHERGGFDAIVGNPPWVAFKGRATQPIAPALAAYFRETSAAFAGYVTLHGVFVERAVRLLRPDGRLGLVVPTSMADLDGYAPTRRAHDAVSLPDLGLPDYGADAFEGVFQPAMAILSTRRELPCVSAGEPWDLAQAAPDPAVVAFVARLSKAALMPEACFGERGFQTSGSERACLVRAPDARRGTPLRCGADVTPFHTLSPSYWVDPHDLRRELRSPSKWAEVSLYVRQTARYPIASLADGKPFRNSILAAFETPGISTSFLLCYLNSTPVRFFHFQRFRDARQGMPQVKIGHLRRMPLPNVSAAFLAELSRLGEGLARRNDGVSAEEQAQIDDAVARAWSCSDAERTRMAEWSRGVGALPRSRRR